MGNPRHEADTMENKHYSVVYTEEYVRELREENKALRQEVRFLKEDLAEALEAAKPMVGLVHPKNHMLLTIRVEGLPPNA